MDQRAPYSENERRLVISFDLGTTFSGVSYALLDPGKVPKIETVTRYPGQLGYDAKIPTVIYYTRDENATVLSVGEELPPDYDPDDDGILKVEWFKLKLQPQIDASRVVDVKLPLGKDVGGVIADFYGYLYQCAREHIKHALTALGELIWDSVKDNIFFVLSHPNSWEGAQQEIMRAAAVKAKLVNEEDSRTRISFVTEGEASMHFCITDGQLAASIKASRLYTYLMAIGLPKQPGDKMMVIDAGGGTVDLSAYSFESAKPVKAVEVAAPACLMEGSVIVQRHAKEHIQAKLKNSQFNDCVPAIVEEFDKSAKKLFKGSGNPSIRFSRSVKDNDAAASINRGCFKITESEMRAFFDPAVDAIIAAIRDQQQAASSHGEIKSYFLVGGFAANGYLYERLRQFLEDLNLTLYRPGASPNKAVAEGAVSFYLDRFVEGRVARYTYGTDVSVPAFPFMFMPPTPKVRNRMETMHRSVDGELWLPGAFSEILKQGTVVSETKEFRKDMSMQRLARSDEQWKTSVDIIAYRGPDPPLFMDEEPANFSTLCEIEANLKKAPRTECEGPLGKYFVIEAAIVLSFGLTEFKAELAWKDKSGVERRSPAKVVYDPDFSQSVTVSN
ncbi:hypothetical protein PENSPDRAFT_679530 [Peniophora sp. CONT]|nr:hypothetical protein PENSPDRAFT_679530 [Peniophora sp. CONT]